MRPLVFLAAIAALALQAPALADEPPPNDLCENAQLLKPGVPVQGTTRGAIWDDLPPDSGGWVIPSPGVWYRAVGDGTAMTVTVSYDTGSVGNAIQFCGGCDPLTFADWPTDLCTEPGTEYLYLVIARDADFTVNLVPGDGSCSDVVLCDPPPNDRCDGAMLLEPGELVVLRHWGASWGWNGFCDDAIVREGWDPDEFEYRAYPGLWYRVTGDGTTLTLRREGSYVEDEEFYLFCGGCEDRSCIKFRDGASVYFLSGLSWCSKPGREYLVHIVTDPLPPTYPDFDSLFLTLESDGKTCDIPPACVPPPPPPPNDSCLDAIPIAGEGVFPFDNRGARSNLGFNGDCFKSHPVWYCWTAPSDGVFTVETCGLTDVPTDITILDGCRCIPRTVLCTAWESLVGQCGYQASTSIGENVRFEAVEGRTYGIVITSTTSYDREPQAVAGGTGSFRIVKGVGPRARCELPPPEDREERCSPPGRWEAYESTRGEMEVVDDFTLAEGGVGSGGDYDSLCWHGTYFDGVEECARSIPDDFEVTYYADDCGVPGDVVAGPFSQGDGTLEVHGPAGAGGRLMDSLTEFQYAARHAWVPLPSGQTYWLKITNSADGDCRWYWEASASRNITPFSETFSPEPQWPDWARAFSYQDGQSGVVDGYDPSDYRPHDMGFCLASRRSFKRTACQDVQPSERCAHLHKTLCPEDRRFPAPPNDDCDQPLILGDEGAWVETLGATTDGPTVQGSPVPGLGPGCDFSLGDDQVHADVWYDYDAACGGPTRLSVCGDAFDTKLAVYADLACPPQAGALVCSDDDCGAGRGRDAAMTFDAVRDAFYRVRLGGYRWDAGSAFLSVSHLPLPETTLRDVASLSNCFADACGTPPCEASQFSGPCCGGVDFDSSGTIDLADHARLVERLVGP